MSYLYKFQEALKGKPFLVLDTETTGLKRGEICQVGIINSNAEIVLDTLVKTKEPIPEDAIRIHGITDEMVKDAPSWPELVPQIKEILDGQLLVVYNATYDRSMMHQSGERHGLDKIEWKEVATWFCAMEAFAEYYGDWNSYHGSYRWQKLSSAAFFCDVEVENAHRALGDCLMTLGVVNHMLKGGQDAE